MCEVQLYEESASRFPCTSWVVHEVQDRSNIVDEVKITLLISSPGSDGGAVCSHYRVIVKRSIDSVLLSWVLS